MPVAGPIAVLVFGQGLEDRGRNALFLAFGGALAESVYAYLAFWGFSAVLNSYPWIEHAARFFAAAMLIGLGIHFYRKRSEKRPPQDPRSARRSNWRSFVLGFTITALNPTLIATWTFTVTTVYSLGIITFHAGNALPFSIGAFSGIVSWFATFLYLLNRFRSSFPRTAVERVLQVMAIALIIAGVAIGYGASRPYLSRWFG